MIHVLCSEHDTCTISHSHGLARTGNVLDYLHLHVYCSAEMTRVQGGITCGAIDEPRKSSKAINERVIINSDLSIAIFFY